MSYRTALIDIVSHTNPENVRQRKRRPVGLPTVEESWTTINGTETLSDLTMEWEGTYYSMFVHRALPEGATRMGHVSNLSPISLQYLVRSVLPLRHWLGRNAPGGVVNSVPEPIKKGMERLSWCGVRYLTLSWNGDDHDTEFAFVYPTAWVDFRLESLANVTSSSLVKGGHHVNLATALNVCSIEGWDIHLEVPTYAAAECPVEGSDWASVQIAHLHQDALLARLGGSRWRLYHVSPENVATFRLHTPSARRDLRRQETHPDYRIRQYDGYFIADLITSPVNYRL